MELNIPLDAFLLISVGELNVNKNNRVILSAMEKLGSKNIHYILCGVGDQKEVLKKQADGAGLHDNVHFLGYRNDVKELYEMANCFVMPSYREGLSRSVMEAMASGLPCIVSNIRGNVDLIEDGKSGFLCSPTSVKDFSSAISKLCDNAELCAEMSIYSQKEARNFDVSVVKKQIREIFVRVLGGDTNENIALVAK